MLMSFSLELKIKNFKRFTQLFSTLIFDFCSDNDGQFECFWFNLKAGSIPRGSFRFLWKLISSHEWSRKSRKLQTRSPPHDEWKRRTKKTQTWLKFHYLNFQLHKPGELLELPPPLSLLICSFCAVNFNFLCARCTLNSSYHVSNMLATLHIPFIRAWVDPIISLRMVTKRSENFSTATAMMYQINYRGKSLTELPQRKIFLETEKQTRCLKVSFQALSFLFIV